VPALLLERTDAESVLVGDAIVALVAQRLRLRRDRFDDDGLLVGALAVRYSSGGRNR
jgi:hypothetical protein